MVLTSLGLVLVGFELDKITLVGQGSLHWAQTGVRYQGNKITFGPKLAENMVSSLSEPQSDYPTL